MNLKLPPQIKNVHLEILSLLFLFFIISSLEAMPKELKLPQPTGVYSVGTKAIEVLDPARTMLRGNNSRRFMIQAFYPSKEHKGVYPYMPETIDDGLVQGTKVLTWSKPNAEFLRTQKFPVIIFVPGRGGMRQQYTILCEELASQGYVVLSIDIPYAASFVKFPDGTKIVLTLKDAWRVPRDRDYRYQYDDEIIESALKDIEVLLKDFNDLNVKELGMLCDPEHIILIGHSLGGNISHILGFKEARIKAVVDIDSKITERKIFGRIGVSPNSTGKPVLFIRGMMQYQEDVGDQLQKIKNATIWSPLVEHSAFSDNAYFAAHIRGFGRQGFFSDFINWLFKRDPHWDSVGTNLGGKSTEQWFSEYRTYVVGWLRQRGGFPPKL